MKINIITEKSNIAVDIAVLENAIMDLMKKTPGISGLGMNLTLNDMKPNKLKNIVLGYSRGARGVRLSTNASDKLVVDLQVIVIEGVNVQNVATDLQESVYYELENTFGIEEKRVEKVNIHITGLKLNK